MGNLINSLPQILANSGSLFGVFALVAIVIAFVVFLLFGKADPKQKERIFLYMTLFFLALTFSALAAGVLTGFKSGGDNVNAIIAKDPSKVDSSLVSLSPNTIKNIEKYLESKSESVTQDSKVKLLEEAVETYINPKPVKTTIVEVTPTLTPNSNPINPIQVDGEVTWEFKKCVRKETNVDCSFVLTTTNDRLRYGLNLNDETKMTDRQGREYFVNYANFVDIKGNKGTNLIHEIQKGSTYNVSIDFTVPVSVTELNSLIVKMVWSGLVKFNNVTIS